MKIKKVCLLFLIILFINLNCTNNYYVFESKSPNRYSDKLLIEKNLFIWQLNYDKSVLKISHGIVDFNGDTLILNSEKNDEFFNIINIYESKSQISDTTDFEFHDQFCNQIEVKPLLLFKYRDSIIEMQIKSDFKNSNLKLKKIKSDSICVFYTSSINSGFHKFNYLKDTINITLNTYLKIDGGYNSVIFMNKKYLLKNGIINDLSSELIKYKKLKRRKAKIVKEELIRNRDSIGFLCYPYSTIQ